MTTRYWDDDNDTEPSHSDDTIRQVDDELDEQEHRYVTHIHIQRMQETITNTLINPELKTLFDINLHKEVITSIKNQDDGMLVKQRPVLMTLEKVTIYRAPIPHQVEIDGALTELHSKVIRQLVVNFETADLIREYDRSARFKDIYSYINCQG